MIGATGISPSDFIFTQLCPTSLLMSRAVAEQSQQVLNPPLGLRNGSRAQLERPRGKSFAAGSVNVSTETRPCWGLTAGRYPQIRAAFPPERLGLLSLLHKRVENSRFEQGCHSEMTAGPAAALPHKNRAPSTLHAGIFWIPSEFMAPINVLEPGAAPTVRSQELGLTFPPCIPGAARPALAQNPQRFPLITATS